MHLWAGIDEAGYGPDLGPLVMTAVVAHGAGDRRPDVWGDRPGVDRAGGDPAKLWVDDSKRLHEPGKPPVRLEAAALAALEAAGIDLPAPLDALLSAVGVGSDLGSSEWGRWLDPRGSGAARPLPRFGASIPPTLRSPLSGAHWTITAVLCEIVGPERFNADLQRTGSKAAVHFAAFARLLSRVRCRPSHHWTVDVVGDKHGGRHFYLQPLADAFPGCWIDRAEEGPALSRYTLRGDGPVTRLALRPRADDDDGLAALASIVSKYLRECWMADFNAFWAARIPGLRPTAGYPVDAARFRRAIEDEARALGLDLEAWWRTR